MSDDGSKIAFYGWSKNTFGTGASAPAWGYIYVRDLAASKTSVGATSANGAPLSLYQPQAWLSGSGKAVVFQQNLKRFSTSTTSRPGIWRSTVGAAGSDMVSIKGLEFGFEMNGTLKVGETILGSFSAPVPDRDGNSIIFLGSNILNDVRAPYNQYNSTAYFNTVLRLDKGAQPVGNQDYPISHSMIDNTMDVDPGGTYVVLGEYKNSVRRYVLWDMLARAGMGTLFGGVVQQDANATFTVCGVSDGAAKILVQVSTSASMALSDLSKPLTKAAYGTSKLLLFDRATATYQLVGVAERKSAGTGAGCEYPIGGGLVRQLSNDGNIVAWRDSTRGYYVRNMATQKTVLVSMPSSGTGSRFMLSGDGRYIAYSTNVSPANTRYLNSNGSSVNQVFRIGPIDTNAGRRFSTSDFAAAHMK